MSPIKHRQAQINGARIHAHQLVLKPKLFLPNGLHPTSLKELQKDMLIKLPGAMLIGISKGGMAGSTDPKVLELAFATSESSRDLPKGMGLAQLAKQHGHKLTPRTKSFGMTFGAGHFNQMLKLYTRKQL
jgi:hypothetical protein